MYSMKRTMTPVPRKCASRSMQRVVVHPALHDGVDLDGREPGAPRGLDASSTSPRRRNRRSSS
jgi:hypothetical protein